MFKVRVLLASLSFLLVSAVPSQANWSVIDEDQNSVREFVVSSDEVVSVPQVGKMYAVVEDGLIIKFVTWTVQMHQELLVTLPYSLMVNYIDITGILRAEPINHGDKIYVQTTQTTKVELNNDFVSAPVIDLPIFDGIPVEQDATEVISKEAKADYSTSITVKPIENNDPNKIVQVQVISNGMSFTSITTDNTNTPVVVDHLPANAFVTVQTVIRDMVTNSDTVIQSVLTPTVVVDIPVLPNSRNVVEDRANISSPKVLSQNEGRGATISFDPIANFDAEKTRAAIMVVSPSGSTTYIGIDGNGGSVNVADLSPEINYVYKMVIRDMDSSEETVILGSLSK